MGDEEAQGVQGTAELPRSQSACPHSRAVGTRWGDPISPERQAELQELLDRWNATTDHGNRKSPFDRQPGEDYGVSLTGADVTWLAEPSLPWKLPEIYLEGADLIEAHLEGADLFGAHLEGANLSSAQLEKADLREARLDHAALREAHLEGATLHEAYLVGAAVNGAHLEGADLRGVHLEGADLHEANLSEANLSGVHLEGANLDAAHLEGTSLAGAFLDVATSLPPTNWTHKPQGVMGPQLADVHWGAVNLTAVDWERIKTLQDEQLAETRRDGQERHKSREARIDEYKAAGRAYRLLYVALRAQGLSAPATRYHFRAEIMDRKALWHQRKFGRWLFSWLLGTFAGYGDYLGRLFATYAIVVTLFACLMQVAALETPKNGVLSPNSVGDALVLSVTSFHGRGIQPPGLTLTDNLARLAGTEAVFGLLIEGIFIAAFTRRVTGG